MKKSVSQCSIPVPLVPTASYCAWHRRVIGRQQGADHAPYRPEIIVLLLRTGEESVTIPLPEKVRLPEPV